MIALPSSARARYQPLEILAQGGFGAAILCRQIELDRRVVIKVLHGGGAAPEEALRRFLAEAKITSRLEHPNIVKVLDFGTGEGNPWIAYEWIEGPSLLEVLDEGPMRVPDALAMAQQIAQALEHAHEQRIFHRDVKAGNIMVTPGGMSKLIDFGIASWDSGHGVRTAAGVIYGTPDTMPPEYIRGEPFRDVSDLYSLGVVLFQALSARLPFEAPNATAMLQQHLNAPPPSLRDLGHPVGAAVDGLVQRMLAKNPGLRPPGCRAFLEELHRIEEAAPGKEGEAGGTLMRRTRIQVGKGPEPGAAASAAATTEVSRPAGQASARIPDARDPGHIEPRPARTRPLWMAGAVLAVTLAVGASLRGPPVRPTAVARFDGPRRAVIVQLPPGPPVEVLLLGSQGETVATTVAAEGEATFTDLEPQISYRVEPGARSPSAFEPLLFTMPPVLRLGRISIFPAGDYILVDFEYSGPSDFVVTLTPTAGGDSRHFTGRGPGPIYREPLTGLRPETSYRLSIAHPSSPGGLAGVEVRTVSRTPSFDTKTLWMALASHDASRVKMLMALFLSVEDPRLLTALDVFISRPPDKRLFETEDQVLRILGTFRDQARAEALILDVGAWLARRPDPSSRAAWKYLHRARHRGFRPGQPGSTDPTGEAPAPGENWNWVEDYHDIGGGPELAGFLARCVEKGSGGRFPDSLLRRMALASPETARTIFLRWSEPASPLALKKHGLTGLSFVGTDRDLDHFRRTLGTDPDPALLQSALVALSTIGTPACREEALSWVRRPPPDRMKTWLATRLGFEGFEATIDAAFGRELLVGEVKARDREVGLLLGADSRTLEPTNQKLADMIVALGIQAHPRASQIEALTSFLDHPSWLVRRSAAWTLGRWGVRGTGPAIVTKVMPVDRSQAATWALGELAEPSARRPLAARLEALDGAQGDEEQIELALAAWALGRIAPIEEAALLRRIEGNSGNSRFARDLARPGAGVSGPGVTRLFLFPFIPYLPVGRSLRPEETLRVKAEGRWGFVGKALQSPDQPVWVQKQMGLLLPMVMRGRTAYSIEALRRQPRWLPPQLLHGDRPAPLQLSSYQYLPERLDHLDLEPLCGVMLVTFYWE